jgi:hypothetical protein
MQSVCTAVNGTTFISDAKMWFQARTLENFLNCRGAPGPTSVLPGESVRVAAWAVSKIPAIAGICRNTGKHPDQKYIWSNILFSPARPR